MARGSVVRYRIRGDVLLERLDGQPIPASMKAPVAAFRKVHGAYAKASMAVDAAQGVRDAALMRVANDDALLDESLEELAKRAAGAGLGTRARPLAGFTRFPVSKLTRLAYKKEADEVLAMARKIASSDAPKEVKSAAVSSAKLATKVLSDLTALVKPQAGLDKALRERDALLPDWTRAYARLKLVARAAWIDSPATFDAVFADAPDIQAPKARRKPKGAPSPAGPSTG